MNENSGVIGTPPKCAIDQQSFFPDFAEELQDEARQYGEIFPSDTVAHLITKHEIPADSEQQFRDFLWLNTSIYLFHRLQQKQGIRPGLIRMHPYPELNLLKPSATKAKFQEIAELANELQLAIDKLDNSESEIFWGPGGIIYQIAVLSDASKSPFGHTIIRRPFGDAMNPDYLKEFQIIEAIEIVKNYADHAAKRMPEDRGGQQHDQTLYLLISNLRDFWIKTLKREFTRSFHKENGETNPISPSAIFCCDITGCLDAKVLTRTINTVMRYVIAMANEARVQVPVHE